MTDLDDYSLNDTYASYLYQLNSPSAKNTDGNGVVNVFDAAYVQKGLTGANGYPPYSELDKSDIVYRAADADGDGTVNIFDAALIQKFVTGASEAQGYVIGSAI